MKAFSTPCPFFTHEKKKEPVKEKAVKVKEKKKDVEKNAKENDKA